VGDGLKQHDGELSFFLLHCAYMLLWVAASDGVQGDHLCFCSWDRGLHVARERMVFLCTYLMCMPMAYIHAYMYEHGFFDVLKLLVLTMFCIEQFSIPERQND
jgi:hypothetical protein